MLLLIVLKWTVGGGHPQGSIYWGGGSFPPKVLLKKKIYSYFK